MLIRLRLHHKTFMLQTKKLGLMFFLTIRPSGIR